MTTWVKSQFIDSERAMTAISVASLSIGVIGFAIVVLTVVFAR